MLYGLLKGLAVLALRWFYRDIEVIGLEAIPQTGPIILAVNHPNSVIDALAVVTTVPRRITLTAKATLFRIPGLGSLLRALHFVPLRRVVDEHAGGSAEATDRERNEAAFDAIVGVLSAGGAVLIFPEGRSHSESLMSPLKTGLARVALQAREAGGVRGIQIIAVGLTFDQKWRARSRLAVIIGESIDLDGWASTASASVPALMERVDVALRAVTLNFPTVDEAATVEEISRTLSALFDSPRPLGAPDRPLAEEVALIRRVAAARKSRDPEVESAAADLTARLRSFRSELKARGLAIGDLAIPTGLVPGARFVVREGLVIAGPGILALWGRINHALPLSLAARLAQHLSAGPEDPAMYTLGLALAFLAIAYAIQTTIVWRLAGPAWATAYLLTLPFFGIWDERFRDRMRRAAKRVRGFWHLRLDPSLQPRLMQEAATLRADALRIEELARGRMA